MKDLIVIVAIMGSGLLLWIFMHREKPMRFRQKSILTGSELDFFFRLKTALPACIICPRVAMSALLEPVGSGPSRQAAYARIEGERVGYAVYDDEMQLVAVVELDHRSRIKRRDAARDAYLAKAGIRTVRFHAKRLPPASQMRASILTPGARSQQRAFSRKVDFRGRRAESAWRNTKIRI